MDAVHIGAPDSPFRLTIDLEHKTVQVGKARAALCPQEYQLLMHLGLCKNTMVTREMLLLSLCGRTFTGREKELNVVRVTLSRLRKKLSHLSKGMSFIDTIPKTGYIIRDDAPLTEEVTLPLAA